MKITGKKISKFNNQLVSTFNGKDIIIGLNNIERFSDKLYSIGFSRNFDSGETVLPDKSNGKICDFNANGKFIINRNEPKETCYRQALWTWKQWSGRYDTEVHTKIVSIPYKRFKRNLISPPSIEISIGQNIKGEKVLRTPEISFISENEKNIIHTVNLFLELFGECSILQKNLNQFLDIPIKKLNWHILPKGKRLWRELKPDIENIVKTASKGNQSAIFYRFELINGLNADFVAIGTAGFRGYVVFGFENINLYILESIYEGNATYVFKNDWQSLSQLTKAEIIKQRLQEDRLIHSENWHKKVKLQIQNSL